MNNPSSFLARFGRVSFHLIFSLFLVLSSLWFVLAIWIQKPFNSTLSIIIMLVWAIFAIGILVAYFAKNKAQSRKISRPKLVLIYVLGFAATLLWYFNIPAKQDRDWSPDVARIFTYEKHGDLVTINDIRDFNWKTEDQYDVHWDRRTFNIQNITGVSIITSYWMGPQIAHTLVSFSFSDQKPLVFSIEIRKEKNESFSAIGGFFRQFELSLIAADEKDIVYTRSNARGEQVYFFPVKMGKNEAQALFLEYLDKSDQLHQHPKWYNTLSSNCTTLVFDMVQAVDPHHLPKDYRLLASGYLPNYLYDLGALDHKWDMKTWYEKAHINPRAHRFDHFKYQDSLNFSKVIRLGLPAPALPDVITQK